MTSWPDDDDQGDVEGENLEGLLRTQQNLEVFRPDDDEQDESLTTALRTALRTTPRLPRDRALVRLALHYAALLDQTFDRLADVDHDDPEASPVANMNRLAGIVAKLGPRYEATLDRLAMSPGARPARAEGGPGGDPASAALDAVRGAATYGAAAVGVDPGAFVDPSVTAADTDQ